MRDKEYLTSERLLKIVAIKSSINLGLLDKLLTIPDPYWITGFAEGDCLFFVNLSKVKNTRTGYKIT